MKVWIYKGEVLPDLPHEEIDATPAAPSNRATAMIAASAGIVVIDEIAARAASVATDTSAGIEPRREFSKSC